MRGFEEKGTTGLKALAQFASAGRVALAASVIIVIENLKNSYVGHGFENRMTTNVNNSAALRRPRCSGSRTDEGSGWARLGLTLLERRRELR
jgi:hypothetical protein